MIAVVILLLGVLAIGAVIAYHMIILGLIVAGVLLALAIGLVMFAYDAGGAWAALLTTVGCIGLALVIYGNHVEEQRKAEEERRRKEAERKAAEEAEQQRLHQEAVAKPWHDRSLKDWKRVLF